MFIITCFKHIFGGYVASYDYLFKIILFLFFWRNVNYLDFAFTDVNRCLLPWVERLQDLLLN